MKTGPLLLLPCLVSMVACRAAHRPPPAPAETRVRVLAHYMPWYRAEPGADGKMIWEHWQWPGPGPRHDPKRVLENGRRDIASVYYPLIGPYDGRDADVLEYHMLSARSVGIQGFVADWYGPASYTDRVFTRMVEAAETYGLQLAVCLEEKAFFPDYSRARTRADVLEVAERHIRHVLETHVSSSAYLHVNGDPVFFMFDNSWQEGALGTHALTPAEMEQVMNRLPTDILWVRTHFDPAYTGVARGHFAWCGPPDYRNWFYETVKDQWREGEFEYYVAATCPGFDDTGVWGWGKGPRVVERRGTQAYEETWREAIAAAPNAIQIVTWNDFEEGTTIEPSEEYGFTFVDLTEEFVAQFTQRPIYLEDNQWPYRLFRLRRRLETGTVTDPEPHDRALDAFVAAYLEGAESATLRAELERLEQTIPIPAP